MTDTLPLLVLRVPRSPEHCPVVVAPGGEPPRRDLRPAEIVGQFRAQDGKPILSRESFSQGQALARHAPKLATFAASARAQGEGYLYIMDGRTPTPRGRFPSKTSLAAFAWSMAR